MVQLQAKEQQRLLRTAKKLGRDKGSFLRALRGSIVLTPSFWIWSLQNCKRIHFYCFKPPGL